MAWAPFSFAAGSDASRDLEATRWGDESRFSEVFPLLEAYCATALACDQIVHELMQAARMVPPDLAQTNCERRRNQR
jgi:hypothetical protein